MAIFELDSQAPELSTDGRYWIASPDSVRVLSVVLAQCAVRQA